MAPLPASFAIEQGVRDRGREEELASLNAFVDEVHLTETLLPHP
jgi:hypothetical protein